MMLTSLAPKLTPGVVPDVDDPNLYCCSCKYIYIALVLYFARTSKMFIKLILVREYAPKLIMNAQFAIVITNQNVFTPPI